MFHAAIQFIKYYLRADTKYRVHSPSLFSFINDVVETDYPYYCYGKIEGLRAQLLQNHKTIEVKDLGAGSNFSTSSSRKISKITSTAVSSFDKCKLLHRIATYYKPNSILELGTSLGLSASYLSYVAPTTTIEGSETIAQEAQSIFNQQDIRVELRVGDISDVINILDKEGAKYDLIYADGNHRKQATIDYFNLLVPMLNEGGAILFDDIYWSKGMTQAWNEIKSDKRVKRTIDLYTFGAVEIGHKEVTEHRTLIKSIFKPFQWGFFSGNA